MATSFTVDRDDTSRSRRTRRTREPSYESNITEHPRPARSLNRHGSSASYRATHSAVPPPAVHMSFSPSIPPYIPQPDRYERSSPPPVETLHSMPIRPPSIPPYIPQADRLQGSFLPSTGITHSVPVPSPPIQHQMPQPDRYARSFSSPPMATIIPAYPPGAYPTYPPFSTVAPSYHDFNQARAPTTPSFHIHDPPVLPPIQLSPLSFVPSGSDRPRIFPSIPRSRRGWKDEHDDAASTGSFSPAQFEPARRNDDQNYD